ncbi:hypothetical protein MTO96_026219 [Rhipicephalus appendiculatus]
MAQVAEGRWAALVARQTVAPAQVQGEREAEVSSESKDEGVSGQTRLVVEPAENESTADLLVVPTAECVPTLVDCEETHPPPSPSVAFVSGATPECVGGKPSDRDNRNQGSAPRERKRLQLKPRSVPVEANQEGDAAPKAAKVAPQASSSIFGGARPVDTAAREREIEARRARQQEEEERRQIRHREPFQDGLDDDRVGHSSVAWRSGRPRRFSDSGRDSYDDGGRQPSSQQCSNDSRRRSQSSSHGSQDGSDALVRDEPGETSKRPPSDRIRRLDFEVKISSAPPSTDTAAESYPKRTTQGHLPRTLSVRSSATIKRMKHLLDLKVPDGQVDFLQRPSPVVRVIPVTGGANRKVSFCQYLKYSHVIYPTVSLRLD